MEEFAGGAWLDVKSRKAQGKRIGGGTVNIFRSAICRAEPWLLEDRARFHELYRDALHLGEVAEALGRSVIDCQAEFGIGEDAKVYKEMRASGSRVDA